MHSKSQARGAGRPREFDHDEVCHRLLALFWEGGYDRVSQQQMVAATGLSTSSLYNAFGTKAETYRQALRRYIDLADDMLEPLERGERSLEDLDEFLDRVEAQLRGPMGHCGCLVALTMTTLTDSDDTVAQLSEEYLARLSAAFAAVLRRAAAHGWPVPEPDATAPLLLAGILGILTTARGTSAGPETFAQLDAVRSLVQSWRG